MPHDVWDNRIVTTLISHPTIMASPAASSFSKHVPWPFTTVPEAVTCPVPGDGATTTGGCRGCTLGGRMGAAAAEMAAADNDDEDKDVEGSSV